MRKGSRAIVWLRRDLRIDDNVALYEACERYENVALAFVLNPPLLAHPSMGKPLIGAFFNALAAARETARDLGSDVIILHGDFGEELAALAQRVRADAVFYNEDYEPAAIARDAHVEQTLRAAGVNVLRYQDHVYFGADEILSPSGAYRIFTPYKRRWFDMRAVAPRKPLPSAAAAKKKLLPRAELGETGDLPVAEFSIVLSERLAKKKLDGFLNAPVVRYAEDRNIPSIEATSRLSADLRAGTIGIRACVEAASAAARNVSATSRENIVAWVSELVWRDFYQMILRKHPRVVEESFQPIGDRIRWRDADDEFQAWCEGRTGYPIVDAGMRQLNETGWMHNRLRMIVASFLTKHLLIDWRRGARYFETRLIDADVGANNGGWQWAASTGTDAAPYFRLFNPSTQAKKIDPSGLFVRRWIPELGTGDYPMPIVVHEVARARVLDAFRQARSFS